MFFNCVTHASVVFRAAVLELWLFSLSHVLTCVKMAECIIDSTVILAFLHQKFWPISDTKTNVCVFSRFTGVYRIFSTVSGCISETVQDRDIHLVCNTNAAVSVMVICTDCAVPACSMSQDGCSLLHCQEQGTTWPRCPSQNSNMPCSYASQRVSNSSVSLVYWCML